ncbi:hypothetical protein [Paracoccus aestuariivivens]|uniref:Uncharacterized protein n=1 Tax=Paracoccus aestuariivivens TaxID=1820333 RepID=A0A6L6JCJ4_9RHOB|nr:hypothetical protein [Paracoccus aestuariivivens]MTH78357.1 hypothetical protein [Paracoccus aestuariivivens]
MEDEASTFRVEDIEQKPRFVARDKIIRIKRGIKLPRNKGPEAVLGFAEMPLRHPWQSDDAQIAVSRGIRMVLQQPWNNFRLIFENDHHELDAIAISHVGRQVLCQRQLQISQPVHHRNAVRKRDPVRRGRIRLAPRQRTPKTGIQRPVLPKRAGPPTQPMPDGQKMAFGVEIARCGVGVTIGIPMRIEHGVRVLQQIGERRFFAHGSLHQSTNSREACQINGLRSVEHMGWNEQ